MNEKNKDDFIIPEEISILPLKNTVIFPYIVIPLMFSNPKLVKLVEEAMLNDKIIGLITQKNNDIDNPNITDLYQIGTVAMIMKTLRFPDGSARLLIQGLSRFSIENIIQQEPYVRAKIITLKDNTQMSRELEALTRAVKDLFRQIIEFSPQAPDELLTTALNIGDSSKLTDFIASSMNLQIEEKQSILNTIDIEERMHKLSIYLSRELNLLKLGNKIQNEIQSKMDENQRRYFLREQMEAIRKELGEEDISTIEMRELEEKIEKANMPEEILIIAERELKRLTRIPPAAAEYTVARTYLDWLIALPWGINTPDNLDIQSANKILERDHYDLDKIKQRILEHLAVLQLKKDLNAPILCFVGPPGVGKTSLGRSIAEAMGRKFVRMSLGGIRDEAEIRGHRRTYIGALPGRIIQGIRTAGTNNPLIMLDEIDKIGTDFRGDPSSALLEVLDPEQNFAFSDHYLEVPFNLSKVMFITTANILDTIPSPLLDRMEILYLTGYTTNEKVKIAQKYLIPRQIEKHGLEKSKIFFPIQTIRNVIQEHTREAGVRNLEREIANICRKVAKKVIEGETNKINITPDTLSEYLGVTRFHSIMAQRHNEIGITTGLAWTSVGGVIQFIEAISMPGKGALKLTGRLGDVMQESAQIALSWLHSKADELNIKSDLLNNSDLHIHAPAGSIRKDGPSAGIALATTLVSLYTQIPVRHDVAMTGEITLQGKVLPIGGIKEKILGAKLAGIKTIILPEENRHNITELSEEIKAGLNFVLVKYLDEVLKIALVENPYKKS